MSGWYRQYSQDNARGRRRLAEYQRRAQREYGTPLWAQVLVFGFAAALLVAGLWFAYSTG